MDISRSLEHLKNVKNSLKRLPKHSRCQITQTWHSKKALEEAHSEILRKSIPFLAKVVKETKLFIQSFDEKKNEEIVARKDYIMNKLKEAKENKEIEGKKSKIIAEIEELEKIGIQKIEKLVIDKDKMRVIIDYLFENMNCGEKSNDLERFVELIFDREASNRTDAYEKIIQILQAGQ